jgi:hypothetical protein
MTGDRLSTAGNRALLDQGAAMLMLLSDELYGERRGGWAPVGAQYRHLLEHYRCFFTGLEEGRVDYDARPRDERIERSREAALAATLECLALLEPLEGAADRPLAVQMDSGAGPQRADWRPSSTGRELQFLCSHTVHHYALIKLLLEGTGLDLGVEFGVAPSSLAHQRAVR